ncbi:MAG: NAD(P)H-hydrate dehydratase [Acidobacteriota bacterium]|nr:MAG: NAD(P)H-hydrate dehydratase [Acidobacteriota bacterium]
MKITTAKQMRTIDARAAKEYGIPSLVLMELAGREVAHLVAHVREERGGYFSVLVVAGPGNNGGDGLVAARYLANAGFDVRVVILAERGRLRGDPLVHLRILERMEVPVHFAHTAPWWEEALEWLSAADIVVDALFGTGFRPPVTDGLLAAVIEDINESARYVLSVDIPSGLSADTGRVEGPVVRADATLWLGYMKLAHVFPPAESCCGSLYGCDLGLPRKIAAEVDVRTEWVTEEEVRAYFPRRKRDAHKGDYGHLLVIGGSQGKGGAPLLAARAALRSGVGLATLAVPESFVEELTAKFPELMVEPLPQNGTPGICEGALLRALDLAKEKSAVALGPGLGLHPETRAFVSAFVKQCPVPMVLDADALNALADGQMEALGERKAEVILTPHPGEMARLLDTSNEEVQGDRIKAALQLAKAQNAFVVLKGYRTVCALPDGYVYLNSTGNPGMATAGSGDALTGIIGAFAANRKLHTLPTAAFAGTYLHGLAGDLAAHKVTEAALTTGDIIEHMPRAIKRIAEQEGKDGEQASSGQTV